MTPNEQAIDDYLKGIDCFEALADYLVVNISSPNTQGLRNLADTKFIEQLAEKTSEKCQKVWIKLDPDMPKEASNKLSRPSVKRGVCRRSINQHTQSQLATSGWAKWSPTGYSV